MRKSVMFVPQCVKWLCIWYGRAKVHREFRIDGCAELKSARILRALSSACVQFCTNNWFHCKICSVERISAYSTSFCRYICLHKARRLKVSTYEFHAVPSVSRSFQDLDGVLVDVLTQTVFDNQHMHAIVRVHYSHADPICIIVWIFDRIYRKQIGQSLESPSAGFYMLRILSGDSVSAADADYLAFDSLAFQSTNSIWYLFFWSHRPGVLSSIMRYTWWLINVFSWNERWYK